MRFVGYEQNCNIPLALCMREDCDRRSATGGVRDIVLNVVILVHKLLRLNGLVHCDRLFGREYGLEGRTG